MAKLSYKFVKAKFTEKGHILLSETYIGNKNKLKVICPNNHEYMISYSSFNRGHGCNICSGNMKLTYEYVKSKFEKEDFTLLSTDYKNARSKLDYICPVGHIGKMTYDSFKAGKRCKQCSVSGKNNNFWKGGVSKLNLPLFDTYAHQLNYCQSVRRDPENNDLLQVRCTESGCRKWFTPTRKQVGSRLYSINSYDHGENNFYCSDGCKNSCSVFHQNKYPKGFKNYDDSYRIPEWSIMVKERDNYECQICGSKENPIAHHYESIWTNPIESADLDMGITICKDCHIGKAHIEVGCRFSDLTRTSICKQTTKTMDFVEQIH